MRRTGCSDALLADVLRAVRASGARGAYTLDVAARELGARVAVAPSPKAAPRKRLLGRRAERASNAIAFVGPTGVGKTTTIAKLATRLVKAGRRVALVNLDNRGLVTKSGDGYAVTKEGRAKANQCWGVAEAHATEAFNGLSDQQIDTFRAVLRHLIEQ